MSTTQTTKHDIIARPKNDSRGGYMFYFHPGKFPRETKRQVVEALEDSGIFAEHFPHEKVGEVMIETTTQGQDPGEPFKTSTVRELNQVTQIV